MADRNRLFHFKHRTYGNVDYWVCATNLAEAIAAVEEHVSRKPNEHFPEEYHIEGFEQLEVLESRND